MSLKSICVIPLDWTLADYRSHSCCDGSHHHLSWAELLPARAENRVTFLVEAKTRKEKTVVWILPAREASTKSPTATALNIGLSFRVGEELAKQIRRQQSWAVCMYSQIRRRRE